MGLKLEGQENLAPIEARIKTLAISASDTASTAIALPAIGNRLRVVSEGAYVAFISVGTGSVSAALPGTTSGSATVTSTAILPGSDVIFSIPSDGLLSISAICRATQTATLDVSVATGGV